LQAAMRSFAALRTTEKRLCVSDIKTEHALDFGASFRRGQRLRGRH
jgi:hypothetical protein